MMSYAAALSRAPPASSSEALSTTSTSTSHSRTSSGSVSSTSSNASSPSTASTNSAPAATAASPPPRPVSPFHPPNETGPGKCQAKQIYPRMERLLINEPVALDFEFQTILRPGQTGVNRLGWVAAVNTKGETVFECYVRYPKEDGTRIMMPPDKFGVSFASIQMNNGAIPADLAEKWLAEIMHARKVILHAGSNDRKAFEYEDAFGQAAEVIDTQDMYWPRHGRAIGLADLARAEFPSIARIQTEGHTPVEDAQATMNLFLKMQPYDRAGEKAVLEAQGLDAYCKPSAQQVKEVKAMRSRHQRAAHTFQGGNPGRGGHGGRGGHDGQGGTSRGRGQSSGRGNGRGRGRGW